MDQLGEDQHLNTEFSNQQTRNTTPLGRSLISLNNVLKQSSYRSFTFLSYLFLRISYFMMLYVFFKLQFLNYISIYRNTTDFVN